MKILKGEANIDFVGRMNVFLPLSAILVVLSFVLVTLMGLNFGIDFAGGYEIQVKFETPVSDGKIKDIVGPLGLGDARVQRFGDEADNEFLIMVREHGSVTDEVKKALYTDVVALAGGEDKVRNWAMAESGESLKAGFAVPITEAQVREVIEKHGIAIMKMTRGEREDEPQYNIDLVSISSQIEEALVAKLELGDYDPVQRVEFVGPQVGSQLRNQGIMAVVWALFFILLYIGVRFDLFFAPGAIVALVHDVAITMGIFALFQFEFNLPIVAAILTIVGYSLNDTIVVYDRIRENAVRLRGRELRALVNSSINQTMSRTLLTSVTTLLVVGALLVFGGGMIRDFSLALAIGVLVGTYSSIAIATPTYILLRERYGVATPPRSAQKERVAPAA